VANIYTRNPIFIDTTFNSYKAQVAVTLGTLFTLVIVKLRWVGPGAIGQVIVDDPGSGNQLAVLNNSAATGPDIELDFSASPRLWTDFSVVIPSGKLLIFNK
jgi:hypothetical protein